MTELVVSMLNPYLVEMCTCGVERLNDKNAFQWVAYRPLVDHIPACTVARGVYLPGGYLPWGCICQGRYLPRWCTCPGGVPARGVPPWGCTCQGAYLPRGCTCPGGVYLPGGTCPGAPLPPVDRQTPAKT